MVRDKWQERKRGLELIKLGYPANKQYLPYLLDFLSDMNWPGAGEVLQYLITLGEPILEPVMEVLRGDDRYWQFNIISYLLEELPLELVKKTERLLIQIAKIPFDEGPDDADQVAISLLARHKLWDIEKIKSLLEIKSPFHLEYRLLLEMINNSSRKS